MEDLLAIVVSAIILAITIYVSMVINRSRFYNPFI